MQVLRLELRILDDLRYDIIYVEERAYRRHCKSTLFVLAYFAIVCFNSGCYAVSM